MGAGGDSGPAQALLLALLVLVALLVLGEEGLHARAGPWTAAGQTWAGCMEELWAARCVKHREA